MKVGEYQHNLLQAVCRASVRKASQGVTERCNLFLITSQLRIEEVLEKTFPGCGAHERVFFEVAYILNSIMILFFQFDLQLT